MNIKQFKVSDLAFDPYQTRIHTPENLAAIRASLIEHGQVETLLVRIPHNYILAGNGRLQVMRELGWESVFCNAVELTDTKAKKISLQLNRSAELSHSDEEALGRLLRELIADGEDSASMGYNASETNRLIQNIESCMSSSIDINDSLQDLSHDVVFDDESTITKNEESQNDDSISDSSTRQSRSSAEQNSQTQPSEQSTELIKDALYFFVEFYGQKERFIKIAQKLSKALAAPNKINSDEFEKMASLYYRYSDGQ